MIEQETLRIAQNGFLGDIRESLVGIAAESEAIIRARPNLDSPMLAALLSERIGLFFVDSSLRAYGQDGRPVSRFAWILLYWLAWIAQRVAAQHREYIVDRSNSFTVRQDAIQPIDHTLNPLWRVWGDSRALQDRIYSLASVASLQISTDAIQTYNATQDMSRVATQAQRKIIGLYDDIALRRLGIATLAYAYGLSVSIAAKENPYTPGIDWALSPEHPKRDHCDSICTIGMAGDRVRPPYSIGTEPPYPDHPHCKCTVYAATIGVSTLANVSIPQAIYEPSRMPYVLLGNAADYASRLLSVGAV